MSYWIEDHMGPILAVVIVGLCVLLVFAFRAQGREEAAYCQQVMALAQTRRDSLDATVACQRKKDADAEQVTMAAAAGAIAGAAASRGR